MSHFTKTEFTYEKWQVQALVRVFRDNGFSYAQTLEAVHGEIWDSRSFETTMEILCILERAFDPCHPPEPLDHWIEEALMSP